MIQELFNISERLKQLREHTRSSVNGWEMGISIPSTQYIVELSKIYNVTTDYILGTDDRKIISVDGLSEKSICAINSIIDCLKSQ